MKGQHLNVSDLDTDQMRTIIDEIRKTLWFNFATNEIDADKEWNMDTLEYISGVLEDHGLRPERKEAT